MWLLFVLAGETGQQAITVFVVTAEAQKPFLGCGLRRGACGSPTRVAGGWCWCVGGRIATQAHAPRQGEARGGHNGSLSR